MPPILLAGIGPLRGQALAQAWVGELGYQVMYGRHVELLCLKPNKLDRVGQWVGLTVKFCRLNSQE